MPTVPVKLDTSGALCGTANAKYQAISATLATPVASFKVPAAASLPAGYTTINADNATTWAINNQTVYMHNFNYNTTNAIDELKLPKLNLVGRII